MKIWNAIVCIFTLVLLASTHSLAHDQKLHKGNPTQGTIASVSSETFELVGNKRNYIVQVNEKTKIEIGDEEVGREHLAKGEKVKVFGTKLPGGKIVAREILVEKTISNDGSSVRSDAMDEK